MARRYNVKHERSPSRYPDRLRDRHESSASVRMQFFDKHRRSYDTIEAATAGDRRSPKAEA